MVHKPPITVTGVVMCSVLSVLTTLHHSFAADYPLETFPPETTISTPSSRQESSSVPAATMPTSMTTTRSSLTTKKYVIATDASTMGNIVDALRQQYRIPLCFEDIQYDPKHDIVTLKDITMRYENIQLHRSLSAREQELLSTAKQLLEGGANPELVFDVNSERYSKDFSGNTISEILEEVTNQTPYQWKERNGTYLIYPRKQSSLDFKVTLDVKDTSLLKVVGSIVSQAPKNNPFDVNATRTFRLPQLLEGAMVPRLKLLDCTAMDALSRAVESANRRIVWSVGGYVGRRNLSLSVLPEEDQP